MSRIRSFLIHPLPMRMLRTLWLRAPATEQVRNETETGLLRSKCLEAIQSTKRYKKFLMAVFEKRCNLAHFKSNSGTYGDNRECRKLAVHAVSSHG